MRELKKPLTEFLQGKNLLKVTSINLQGENLSAIPDIVFKCKNLRKSIKQSTRYNSTRDYMPKETQSVEFEIQSHNPNTCVDWKNESSKDIRC